MRKFEIGAHFHDQDMADLMWNLGRRAHAYHDDIAYAVLDALYDLRHQVRYSVIGDVDSQSLHVRIYNSDLSEVLFEIVISELIEPSGHPSRLMTIIEDYEVVTNYYMEAFIDPLGFDDNEEM